MKIKLLKQFGEIPPGEYDWAQHTVERVIALGYGEAVEERPIEKIETPQVENKIEKATKKKQAK